MKLTFSEFFLLTISFNKLSLISVGHSRFNSSMFISNYAISANPSWLNSHWRNAFLSSGSFFLSKPALFICRMNYYILSSILKKALFSIRLPLFLLPMLWLAMVWYFYVSVMGGNNSSAVRSSRVKLAYISIGGEFG